MLPYFQKHCYETLISKRRVRKLFSAISRFAEEPDDLATDVLSGMPGESEDVDSRILVTEEWLGTPDRGRLGLNIFFPEQEPEFVFALALRSIATLSSDWGERYDDPTRAFLLSFGYGTDASVAPHLKRWRERLARKIQDEFRLTNPPRIASVSRINNTFETLDASDHLTPEIPQKVLDNFDMYRDQDVRSVLIRTKQAREPTIANIAESAAMEASEVRSLIAGCIGRGMIDRQYNVLCDRCGEALARVTSRPAVRGVVQQGVLCPACGNTVETQSSIKCYHVGEGVSRALAGSQWMGMYLRKWLADYWGYSEVVTEVQHGPNEIDLVANLNGSLMLMELKDDRFSMGHAYSFVGKCTQYNPDFAVIVATEGCDSDVKDYIDNLDITTLYVEDIDDLESSFDPLFTRIHLNHLAQVIREYSWEERLTHSLLAALGVDVGKVQLQRSLMPGSSRVTGRRVVTSFQPQF